MCLSLGFLEQLLIWLVIVVAIVAFVKLLLPFILSQLGADGGVIMGAINIFIWAVIAVFLIYLVFSFVECLGGGLPFRH